MDVTLFTRRDCELCDQAKAVLQTLQPEFPHRLIEIDIEADPSLVKQYAELIPVLKIGPYTLQAPFSPTQVRVSLGAAKQSQAAAGDAASADQRGWALRLNQGLVVFARHWLAVFNLLVFTYVSLPFAAPVLMEAGATGPANLLYTLYSPFCHQLAFRSWFLFGEQPAYPRELADSELRSYGEATGFDELDYAAARAFRGDEQLGYKVALCERDIAIYGGILLAGLVFGPLRKYVKPLPIALWLLLGVLPIALDGGSQLLSVFPLYPLPARESTPFLRSFTGALFGVMNVWMAYPYVEQSMRETQAAIAAKLSVARQRDGQS
jgi:uncharacterized membrane protein/glutaredoxin